MTMGETSGLTSVRAHGYEVPSLMTGVDALDGGIFEFVDVRRGFRDDSEEVEGRVSGRRMDAGPGESRVLNRDGGYVKDEGVGLDDSNEEGSCPVHVRDLKLRVSKTRV